jgi:WD40 repeat protein
VAGDGNPDVFVSYARVDQAEALELMQALESAGWSIWMDTEDVPPASKWREELAEGIQRAHTFLFVITPDSVRSEYCLWELAHAAELAKRIVPVVLRDAETVPEALSERQYVFARVEDDRDTALQTLKATLATDLEWVRAHRQWLTAAMRWDAHGRERSLLIRGGELREAESWLAMLGTRTEPLPTHLQTQFLVASRAGQTRRLQITVAGVALAFAVAVALGVLALLQRNAARNEAAIARSREYAIAADQQLSGDPELSLLLAIQAVETKRTPEADNALRKAVTTTKLRLDVPARGRSVGNLVGAVAFSEDGRLAAEGLEDGGVWVASSTRVLRRQVRLMPAPAPKALTMCSVTEGQPIRSLAFSTDGRFLAAVNAEGWMTVWPLRQPGSASTSPVCGVPDVSGLAFARDGELLTVTGDGRLIRWPWRGRGEETQQRLGPRVVLASSFGAGGATLAVLANGAVLRSGVPGAAPVPAPGAYVLAASADGRRVVAAGGKTITVAGSSTGDRRTLRPQPATVRSVAMSRDGRFVATGGQDGAIRIWDLETGGPPVVLSGTNGAVTALSFSRDGRRIVSGGDNGELKVWAWRAPAPVAGVPPGANVSLSTDGRFAFTGGARSGVVSRIGGGRVGTLDGLLDPLRGLSVGAGGKRAVGSSVATLGGHGTVRIWDLRRGPRPRTVGDSERIDGVALSDNGRWIASATLGALHVWRWPGTPAQSVRVSHPPQFLDYTAPAFSPDGRQLLAGAFNGKESTILAWSLPLNTDASTPPLPYRLLASATQSVTTIAFSPDGKQAVASTADGSVVVFDVAGDKSPTILHGHAGLVEDAAFSPDGTEVVSGGEDGTVRIWQLDEAAIPFVLVDVHQPVSAVAFTRDGGYVIGISDNRAHVWRCDACGNVNAVLFRGRRMAARALTPDERELYLHQQ